jgi:hypothetical protein
MGSVANRWKDVLFVMAVSRSLDGGSTIEAQEDQ